MGDVFLPMRGAGERQTEAEPPALPLYLPLEEHLALLTIQRRACLMELRAIETVLTRYGRLPDNGR